MGWFSKKKEEKKSLKAPEVPELPELPKLPDIPPMSSTPNAQFPSFPNNSLGNKISQDIIKEAVTGKKEGLGTSVDELELPRMPMFPRRTQEIAEHGRNEMPRERGISPDRFQTERKVHKDEPVFIRIDKFEESLKIFQKTKEKINQITSVLDDIKRIKEEEEKELDFWESEIQAIKDQIERVDSNLFSKLE